MREELEIKIIARKCLKNKIKRTKTMKMHKYSRILTFKTEDWCHK